MLTMNGEDFGAFTKTEIVAAFGQGVLGIRMDWYINNVVEGSGISFLTPNTSFNFRSGSDRSALYIALRSGVLGSGGSRELTATGTQLRFNGGLPDNTETLQIYTLTVRETLTPVAYLPAVQGERIAEVDLAETGNSVNAVGIGTWSTPSGVTLPSGFSQETAYLDLPAERPPNWTGIHIEVRVDTDNVADRFLPWGELFAASDGGIIFRVSSTNYEVIPVVYYSGNDLRLGLAAGQSTFPADTVVNIRGGGVFT